MQKNLKDMFIMGGRNLAVGRSSATSQEINGIKDSKLKSNVAPAEMSQDATDVSDNDRSPRK